MAGSWSFVPATAAFAASAGAFPSSAALTKAFSGPSLSRASWSWSVSVTTSRSAWIGAGESSSFRSESRFASTYSS